MHQTNLKSFGRTWQTFVIQPLLKIWVWGVISLSHFCAFDQHSTFNSHNISWNSFFIGILLLLTYFIKYFAPLCLEAANSSLKQYRAESWHYKRPRNAWVVTVCHRHSSCAFKASIWTAQHHCTKSVFVNFIPVYRWILIVLEKLSFWPTYQKCLQWKIYVNNSR